MAYLGQVDRKASNVQVFNVTSSTSATHSIGWTPPSEQTLIVTINGVKQHTNAYSFSGAVLTLSSALVATDELEVIGINDIGNSLTPVDGSVTASKLGADSVITAKILDNNVTLAKMADGTQGDTLYYGAAGAPTLLAKPGTPADEVLTFATGATAPSWVAASSPDNTPYFSAYVNTTYNVTSDTHVTVAMDTEYADSDSAFDTSTYEFTVPAGKGGSYWLNAYLVAEGEASDMRDARVSIKVNNVKKLESNFDYQDNYINVSSPSCTGILVLSAADVLKVETWTYTYHSSGLVALHGTWSGTSGAQCVFSGYRLIG
jgi:hypothetical protein